MLNKAHALHRQAEKASRKGRVEEAIQLHKEAADILRDLLQTIINDKVTFNFYYISGWSNLKPFNLGK